MSYQIRPMSFAEILDTAFRLVRDDFTVLVGLAAVIYVPLQVLAAQIQPAPGVIHWGRMAVVILISLVGAPIVATALTHAVGEIYLGRQASIGQSLRMALRILVPLAGTILLLYLGVVAGLVLLVVPGIYLMLAWLLTWQVVVLEGRFGPTALGRSRALMKGNFLRAMGILLLGGLIVGVVGGVLGLVFGLVPVLGPIADGLARAVGVAYSSTVSVVLYFDIRCRKEAFDLDHLARLVESAGPQGDPAPA